MNRGNSSKRRNMTKPQRHSNLRSTKNRRKKNRISRALSRYRNAFRRQLGMERLEDRQLLAGDLLVNANAGHNAIHLSLNAAGTDVIVDVDGSLSSNPLAGLTSISVNGLGGDDTLTVDSSNGLIPATINYDGGDDFDTLVLDGTTVFDSQSYVLGADPSSGTIEFVSNGVTGRVAFTNIEPVQDNVTAANVTINGTNGNNAINYSQGPGGGIFVGTTGLVSVDGFETYEFNNKTNLVINGGAGSDVIHLNYQDPTLATTAPAGLTSINVLGGDPTASDKLIVNAVAGIADILSLRPGLPAGSLPAAVVPMFQPLPLGIGTGAVVESFGAPTVFYQDIEDLALVVQEVDVDSIQIGGTVGNDTIEYTPGANLSEGGIRGTLDSNNATTVGPFALPNVTFSGVNVGPNGAGAPVPVPGLFNSRLGINDDPTATTQGGADTLIFNGSSENDVFQVVDDQVYLNINGQDPLVAPFPAPLPLGNVVGALGIVTPGATSTAQIIINAGNGDDTINMLDARNIGGPAINYDINGGNPASGSDTLSLTGAAGTAENVNIVPDSANPDDQDITGLGARIDVTGIELIRYAGADADDSLTVDPGNGDNVVRVEAAHPGNWDGVHSDSLPDIEFIGLQNFTVDATTGAGSDVVTFKTWNLAGAIPANYAMTGGGTDTLVIEGTDGSGPGNDRFFVRDPDGAAANSVQIEDTRGTNATGTPTNVIVTATTAGLGRLQINTLGGDDWVTVDAGATDVIGVPITFDGGANSDLLRVTGTPATTVNTATYSPGAAVTEGRLTYDGDADPTNGVLMTIDFVGLEPVQDNLLAVNTVVNGTNANNAINYSQGPGGGIFVGTTGLVSVDGFETYEFNNKTNLILNGQAGDDVIHLNYQDPTLATTAPAGLTSINVLGGDPTASDKLIVNGVAGIADILSLRPGLPAGSLPPAVVPMFPPLPLGIGTGAVVESFGAPTVFYQAIEDLALVVQEVDVDAVQIGGTVGNDTIEYTPGANLSEGGFRGTLDSNNATTVGPFALPNVTFSGLNVGPNGAGAPVPVPGLINSRLGINDDPTATTQGGADTLILNGSSENDVFQVVDDQVYLNINGQDPLVAPFPAPLPLGNVLGALGVVTPGATSTAQIIINAGNGDDTINMLDARNIGGPAINYDINGGNPGGGSDVLNLVDPEASAPFPVTAQTVSVVPDPVNPTQQDVWGYAASGTSARVGIPIDVTGIELIAYTGGAALGAPNDTFIVDPVGADDEIRVEAQNAAPGVGVVPPFAPGAAGIINAKVTSQTLPEIQFRGTLRFDLSNPDITRGGFAGGAGGELASPGAVEATFVTLGLDPVTVYNLNGNNEDKLVIEGADTFPDIYSVTNPTGTGLAGPTRTISVFDHNTGVNVNNFFGPTNPAPAAPPAAFLPGEIRFNTLAGDDQVYVHAGPAPAMPGAPIALPAALAGVDLVDTRIVYDGGTGGDNLTIFGVPVTAVTNEVYTPGPVVGSGRIDFGTSVIAPPPLIQPLLPGAADISGATLNGTMQIEFSNLLPVQSLVQATTLIVNANNQDNTISYSAGPNSAVVNALNPAGLATGLVAVDNNETIEFANKVSLALNGLAGDDTINLENTSGVIPAAPLAPGGILNFIMVNGGIGSDTIDGSGNTTATPLMLYGGPDDDTLIGGLGGDLLLGGIGNDTLVDSAGNDYFDGGNNGQIPLGVALVPPLPGPGNFPTAFPLIPLTVPIPAAIADPINATSGFDTIVVPGTPTNDIIGVTQGAPTAVAGSGYPLAIVNTAGGVAVPPPPGTADVIATVAALAVPNALLSRPSVEEVRIEAGLGNDEIVVAHADAYVAASVAGVQPAGSVAAQMVRFDVRGDAPNSSDRLTVQDLLVGDLVLLRQAVDQRSGRVTVAPAVNTTTLPGFLGDIVYSGIENVDITPVNPLTGGTGATPFGQVVVFDTDPFEFNDNILNPTDIGDFNLVTRSPNIDPGNNALLPVVTPSGNGDEDWYAFTPDQNGTFQINTLFKALPAATTGLFPTPVPDPIPAGARPGLPGAGVLASGLYTAVGAPAPVVVGSPLNDAAGAPIGNQLQFSGVKGVTYYLRVTGTPLPGAVTSASPAINKYDVTLAQIDNLGPQVFDPDGAAGPAQAIQIADAPYFNLFTNKQGAIGAVAGPPAAAPALVGATLTFTPTPTALANLAVGSTVTFTTGPNFGRVGTVAAITPAGVVTLALNANIPAQPAYVLPAVGDTFSYTPVAQTPTPNVHALTINFRDPINGTQVGVAPGALLGALDPATALDPGNYSLVGDATGQVAITSVNFATPGTVPVAGAVAAGTPAAPNTTLSINAGAALSLANGPIVGQTIQFTGGTAANIGFTARITAYNAATGSLRVASPFPAIPSSVTPDAFIILPTPNVVSPVNVFRGVTAVAYPGATTNGGGAFAGDVNIAGNIANNPLATPASYIGQVVQITDSSLNIPLPAGQVRTTVLPQERTIVGVTAAGNFVFNAPFTGAVPAGTTFNIVGTPATTSGIVAPFALPLGPANANSPITFGAARTPAAAPAVLGPALNAANGFYVGQALTFTTGALAGQSHIITAYDPVNGFVFTFDQPFTATPANGDAFFIAPAAQQPIGSAVFSGPLSTPTVIVGGAPVLVPPALASFGGLSATPGDYVGQVLQFTTGALTGQAQLITAYDGGGNFTVANPFTAAPATADTFIVHSINAAAVTLNFAAPLPDDRFTLTVNDSVRDYAGNQLDGESNAAQPLAAPTFPSGDGTSGGDFVARFTVDSRPEIGVTCCGSTYIDINGNHLFDPKGKDNDDTNRDLVFRFGRSTDTIFAGNFAPAAATFASGFDKLGAYGFNVATGNYEFALDFDHDGAIDFQSVSGVAQNAIPVAGNFSAAHPGDEIGLFNGTRWFLDVNGNNVLAAGEGVVISTLRGLPIVGDFDGDGLDDLAVYDAGAGIFTFDLAIDGFGTADVTASPIAGAAADVDDRITYFNFVGFGERPLAADMNQDGVDDLGLFVPGRRGVPPQEGAEFYFLLSDNLTAAAGVANIPRTIFNPYSPAPLGNDKFGLFGDEFALPIVGNFDPPPYTKGGVVDAAAAVEAPNQGETVNIVGTPANDHVELLLGETTHVLTVNGGVAERFDADTYTRFVYADGQGDDSFVVTSNVADVSATLRPFVLELTSATVTVEANGIEDIRVDAKAGTNNTADFFGSDGIDRFVGKPDSALMKGTGYNNKANKFDHVVAHSGTTGAADRAKITDSPGDEQLTANPGQVALVGDAFSITADEFERVYVNATEDGSDTAIFGDSAGDDRFTAKANWSRMIGDGYFNQARLFDSVVASATLGGEDDQAAIYDTSDNDQVTATPEFVSLVGGGVQLKAESFEKVTIYSKLGGSDEAVFEDSTGKDRFTGTPEYSRLEGAGYSNRVNGFGSVIARASNGDDNDRADLSDSRFGDLLVATATHSILSGPGYSLRVELFDRVFAEASRGNDRVEAYDGIGADLFEAAGDTFMMKGELYRYAGTGFDKVTAHGDNGGPNTLDIGAVDFLFSSEGDWG